MKLTKYQRPLPTNLFNFFDDAFTRTAFGEGTTFRPAVNVKESDTAYTLELIAPGRRKDDFKLEVKDQLLTISYSVKEQEATEKDGFLRREYRLEDFRRSFHLDEKVIDDEAIEASYTDGILTVNLPKRAEVQPKQPKLITVG